MSKNANNRLTKHHILPISRDRSSNEIVLLPYVIHTAYHRVFSNLTLREAHIFLDVLMRPNRRWHINDIVNLQIKLKRNK